MPKKPIYTPTRHKPPDILQVIVTHLANKISEHHQKVKYYYTNDESAMINYYCPQTTPTIAFSTYHISLLLKNTTLTITTNRSMGPKIIDLNKPDLDKTLYHIIKSHKVKNNEPKPPDQTTPNPTNQTIQLPTK